MKKVAGCMLYLQLRDAGCGMQVALSQIISKSVDFQIPITIHLNNIYNKRDKHAIYKIKLFNMQHATYNMQLKCNRKTFFLIFLRFDDAGF